MTVAKLFANGRSQAVRLPKDCRFAGDQVMVRRVGDLVVLFPADKGWELLSRSLDQFTPDFMARSRRVRNRC